MNKNDLFLGAVIETIFSYPLQSLCFIIAGGLLMLGLIVLIATRTNNKWQNRGEALIVSGTLIATPVIIPLFIGFVGINIISHPTFHAVLSVVYFSVPFIGAIAGYLAWIDTDDDIGGKVND